MLCGPNGAGKTTLIRLLGTALSPTAGTLALFGMPADENVRPRVGMLSHADHHYDELTARENLQLAHDLGAARVPVADTLARVGLAARADEPVRGFSAGMRKRLAFGRLLGRRTDLVLLDEPYAGLDPAGAAFVDELVRAWRTAGTTVVVSTHQVQRVAPLCDRAVVLTSGRVTWTGPATDALAHALPPGDS